MVMYPTKFKTKEKQKFTEYKVTYNIYCMHMNTSGWSPQSLGNKLSRHKTNYDKLNRLLFAIFSGVLYQDN